MTIGQLEGERASRISYRIETGGYRDDEERWPEIQDDMINAMIRFEEALQPYIEQLPQ